MRKHDGASTWMDSRRGKARTRRLSSSVDRSAARRCSTSVLTSTRLSYEGGEGRRTFSTGRGNRGWRRRSSRGNIVSVWWWHTAVYALVRGFWYGLCWEGKQSFCGLVRCAARNVAARYVTFALRCGPVHDGTVTTIILAVRSE